MRETVLVASRHLLVSFLVRIQPELRRQDGAGVELR